MAFVKISGRTERINKQIGKLKIIRQNKAMRKLFDLLVKNTQYGENLAKGITVFHAQSCKSVLITKLKGKILYKRKTEAVVKKIQSWRKR